MSVHDMMHLCIYILAAARGRVLSDLACPVQASDPTKRCREGSNLEAFIASNLVDYNKRPVYKAHDKKNLTR